MQPLAPAKSVRRNLAAACLASALLAAGCSRNAPPAAAPPPDTPRHAAVRSAQPNHVQQTPEYREAVRLYRANDYAGALAALHRIHPGADWPAEDRAYLARQIDIVEGRRSKVERGAAATPGPRPVAPVTRSAEGADCGPRALLFVCERLGVRADLAELRRLAGTTGAGTTMEGLAKAAAAKGLHAEGIQMNRTELGALATPAIAWVSGDHYIAVLSVKDGQAEVHDPNAAGVARWGVEELLRKSGGMVLRVEGRTSKVERGK